MLSLGNQSGNSCLCGHVKRTCFHEWKDYVLPEDVKRLQKRFTCPPPSFLNGKARIMSHVTAEDIVGEIVENPGTERHQSRYFT